jgi:hypothetical protein
LIYVSSAAISAICLRTLADSFGQRSTTNDNSGSAGKSALFTPSCAPSDLEVAVFFGESDGCAILLKVLSQQPIVCRLLKSVHVRII